jgi:hypothetical protein
VGHFLPDGGPKVDGRVGPETGHTRNSTTNSTKQQKTLIVGVINYESECSSGANTLLAHEEDLSPPPSCTSVCLPASTALGILGKYPIGEQWI